MITLCKILGTWPIPRRLHAKMINQLEHFGTKVVALDITYPEKAPVCGPDNPDIEFGKALHQFSQKGKAFIAYTLAQENEDPMSELPDSLYNFLMDSKVTSGSNLKPYFISQNNFPIKELADSGAGLAHISMEDDFDGIFRSYRIVANVDSLYFGSLGLSAYEAFTGESLKLEVNSDNTAVIHFKDQNLNISAKGDTKIRFIGGMGQFHSISLYDLLEAKPDDPKMKEALQGKIAFVGSTATGAHDLRPTALDAKLPGVFVHMNITHMLLNQYFFKPADDSILYSLLFMIFGTSLLLIVQYFGFAIADIAVLLTLIGGSFLIEENFLINQGYELKLFYCYLCFFLTYSWNTFLNFMKANNEKKQIKGTFSRYVSPQIVKDMLDNPEKLKVGGEKKDITCFFSDVRDFTSISENMTAVELSTAMNRYMGEMTGIVFEFKGTLDKYIGDAIVAIWGAPVEIENHAQYAVDAAIKMMEALPAINLEFKAKGWPEFKVGCGLNSGECAVGNMGSDKIFSYTALGDNMNLGARLEGLSKNYGAHIIISEFTHKRLDHSRIKTRILDRVQVKGKAIPVTIYEVLHPCQALYQDEKNLTHYKNAYQLFLDKKLPESLELFKKVIEVHDDKATKRLIELIKSYMESGIPEWGDHDVTIMTTK
jgi:adenylate cyclase